MGDTELSRKMAGEKAFCVSGHLLLREEIPMEDKLSKISTDEYFTSRAFRNRMKNFFYFPCRQINRPLPDIGIECGHNDGPAAYNDGKKITVNLASEQLRRISGREEQFLFILGLLTHEFGHYRFTDFPTLNLVANSAQKMTFFPAPDDELLRLPGYAQFQAGSSDIGPTAFLKAVREFHNIFEDGYVEEACYRSLSGKLVDGLTFVRNIQWEDVPSLSHYMDLLEADASNGYIAMHDILLEYSKWGKVKYDPVSDREQNFLNELMPVFKEIDMALYEDDPVKRTRLYNKAFVLAWPYIYSGISGHLDTMISSTSSVPSGMMGAVPPDLHERKISGSLYARRRFESELLGYNVGDDENTEHRIDRAELRDRLRPTLQRVAREVADEKRSNADEHARAQEYMSILDETVMPPIHSDVTMIVNCVPRPIESEIEQFRPHVMELLPIVEQIHRDMKRALPCDMSNGWLSEFSYSGGRIDIARLVYNDCKLFRSSPPPIQPCGLCVLLLVDESGSMCGQRISATRDMCLVLYQVFRKLGVPCAILGHTETYSTKEVQFDIFAGFEDEDSWDVYRIFAMDAKENNRDGAALCYAGQMLFRRQEQVKILISVSDGAPLAHNYRDAYAIADVVNVIKELRRRGVNVFSAAIGEDKDSISEIYGSGFFGIDNLSEMSSDLAALVRRFIPSI